jgi:hypothetical protein
MVCSALNLGAGRDRRLVAAPLDSDTFDPIHSVVPLYEYGTLTSRDVSVSGASLDRVLIGSFYRHVEDFFTCPAERRWRDSREEIPHVPRSIGKELAEWPSPSLPLRNPLRPAPVVFGTHRT